MLASAAKAGVWVVSGSYRELQPIKYRSLIWGQLQALTGATLEKRFQCLGGCSNHGHVPVAIVAGQSMACVGLPLRALLWPCRGCRNCLHQLCDRVKYPGWKPVSSSKGAAYGSGEAMGWLNHPHIGQLNRQREHNRKCLPAVTSFSAPWLANRTLLAWFLPLPPIFTSLSLILWILQWFLGSGLAYFFSCTLLFAVAKCHLPSQHIGGPQSKGSGVWGNKEICLIQVSFGLSINWEINVMSPSTPYWLGLCM